MVDSLCGYVSFPEWENHVLHVCCELIQNSSSDIWKHKSPKDSIFCGEANSQDRFFWGRPAGKQTFDWSVMPKISHWQWIALPKTNIAPEKKWLEDYFLRPFLVEMLFFGCATPPRINSSLPTFCAQILSERTSSQLFSLGIRLYGHFTPTLSSTQRPSKA